MRNRLGKILIIIGILGFIVYIVLLIIARTSGIEEGSLLDQSNLFPNIETRDASGPGELELPDIGTQSPDDDPANEQTGMGGTLDRLLQISPLPVAAFGAYLRDEPLTTDITVTTPVVRYSHKDTGHIYETILEAGLSTQQLSDTDIFNSHEGWLNSDVSRALLRFFNQSTQTIQTFIGTLSDPTGNLTCPYPIETTLRPGDTGRDVENLQQILLGTAIPHNTNPTPGVYDEVTKELALTFQRSVGLTDDGIIGSGTRAALETECVEQVTTNFLEATSNDPGPLNLVGTFLPENILEVTLAPNKEDFAYLVRSSDTTAIVATNFSNPNQTTIIWTNTGFSEWRIDWITNDLITLTTKASGVAPGYLYHLNPITGEYQQILSDINGLTTLTSPNKTKVLYNKSTTPGEFSLYLKDITTNATEELPFTGMTDKCAWTSDSVQLVCGSPTITPDGTYPDDWYLGRVALSDVITVYNTNTGIIEETISPNAPLDVDRPQILLNDTLFGFLNKNNNTLWMLSL